LFVRLEKARVKRPKIRKGDRRMHCLPSRARGRFVLSAKRRLPTAQELPICEATRGIFLVVNAGFPPNHTKLSRHSRLKTSACVRHRTYDPECRCSNHRQSRRLDRSDLFSPKPERSNLRVAARQKTNGRRIEPSSTN
jgi:hypothetical protein